MWMLLSRTFDIDQVQCILQRNLHYYLYCHFSDQYYHLKELEMFIYDFYVNDELVHLLIGYEIARVYSAKGHEMLDIKRIMILYQFSSYLIVNSNISMICG